MSGGVGTFPPKFSTSPNDWLSNLADSNSVSHDIKRLLIDFY